VLRVLFFAFLLALLATVVLDLNRPPAERLVTHLAVVTIHLYQRTLSPLMDLAGINCRFEPTCSRYAEAVLVRDGLLRGGWLTLRRLARCGPWTPAGTRDPP
jgi:putative membrane protein insertion efficiency factor